ncbi:MAG: pyridoxamine 5'-phosphate oxidase family protein [Rhodospirillaceae bacterium]|mgnify:CR=1 FL=1|jgi:hypothetical protein|nr:pyridoxamine 5'-phosphate oxidase family protein [Rhodospirillaceae bacterium]MBT4042470.1 pyridoxamine 5'-phosphate oxidase family protein [Rhodospirillaceae bacterium]MBT4687223.1 pyridoxamine 5'-phosphate oxidase family protein [Rhodospirillaceae bacterium]MBT5082746.1 pyridoxamine 5'-phosphate oxidase family protein [Rhodospirillaceae bacterium]MBT5524090.1 pyridoxamine 5'-phosphate oxidase family protein [Rhodospirillaceae bacterium]
MSKIKSKEHLREIYPPAVTRALDKQMTALDVHCRQYISLSPFVILATKGDDSLGDATPRGGEPGFVHVESDGAILIPDWPGNNRLDTLENIIDNPGIGLLFLIPGVKETLRINGTADIVIDEVTRHLFETRGKHPRSVIRIHINEVYLHCAKALMRSHLWEETARIDRAELPSMGQMINDQTGASKAPPSQSEMEKQYEKILY